MNIAPVASSCHPRRDHSGIAHRQAIHARVWDTSGEPMPPQELPEAEPERKKASSRSQEATEMTSPLIDLIIPIENMFNTHI